MKHETKEKVFALLLIELEKAERKHPDFLTGAGIHSAMTLLTEEHLEQIRAVNDGEPSGRVLEESAHVAVVAMRLIGRLLEESNLQEE